MTNQIEITQEQYVNIWNDGNTSPLLTGFHGVTLGRSKHESGIVYLLEVDVRERYAGERELLYYVINADDACYLLVDVLQNDGDPDAKFFIESIDRIIDGQALISM